MRGYMFRNRWGALLFVGLVLAAVTRLVGTGHGDGALDLAKEQLAEQKAQAERMTSGTRRSAERATKVEFASDEELIDPAVGEDPTPIDQRLAGETDAAGDGDQVPHDTIILVNREDIAAPPGPLPGG